VFIYVYVFTGIGLHYLPEYRTMSQRVT